MVPMTTAIFWFRQDLRLHDNPGLTLACKTHQKIIPLYINEMEPSLELGGAQHWWLHHSLISLKAALEEVHLDLFCFRAEPLTLLKQLIRTHKIDAVYWNRCYEPVISARDKHIKEELKSLGITVISCNGSLLHEPWEVLNQGGSYFKVFTPYWRQCVRQMNMRPLMEVIDWPTLVPIKGEDIGDWNLLPQKPNWAKEFPLYWQPGEQGAQLKLKEFLHHALEGYKEHRNEPATSGTSRLSPHLHFGEISPQQIWTAVHEAMNQPGCDLNSAQTFLSELGWREFSYNLLYHFPKLMTHNFKDQFDRFPWQNDESNLHKWQRGITGYPLVDAGMRELWVTGYMHNRVRMIVASFLTKHLMIDWRKGAAWFWDTLLDADLANNSASWQWVAGSGADASPYYRIFNPILQGEKFDPQGEYVRRWIPELKSVSSKWIHHPWDAPAHELPITLGVDYPLPIVDHILAREVALASYQQIKG